MLESDFDRPLTLHGQAQARAVGAHIRDTGLNINRIMCSPALRTRETVNGLLAGWQGERPELVIVDRLYDADHETLLEVAIEGGDDVLLVAHNPGVHELAFTLTHDARLDRGYVPATLSTISYEAEPGTGKGLLENLFVPAV